MKYGQKVRIKDGFYEGIEGMLIHTRTQHQADYDNNHFKLVTYYGIRIDDELIEYFPEENLILI